jgi:hypothetical protein
MTMSPLSRVETSQTSIVPMAPPMPHRPRLADRRLPLVQVVPQVNAAGGIVAGAAARVAVVVAGAVVRSNGTIRRAE